MPKLKIKNIIFFPKFDNKTYKKFVKKYNTSSILYFRLAIILVLIISILFYILDYYLIPIHLKQAWTARTIFIEIPLIISFFLSYKTKFIQKYFQETGSILILSIGLAVNYMIYISSPEELAYTNYFIGLLLVMTGTLIIRLRFKAGTSVILFHTVIYFIIAIFKQKLASTEINPHYPVIFINNLIFILTIIVSLIFVLYILENSERRSFLAEEELKIEKQKVEQNFYEIQAQKYEIEKQKQIIEEKHKHLTESINYAKRLQNLILPTQEIFKNNFKDFFIIYIPKSIINGDFYWATKAKNQNTLFFAVVDCTGHGVPGAFMSIIGFNLLNESLFEKNYYTPSQILAHLSKRIFQIIRTKSKQIQDGMDLTLLKYDFTSEELVFSGAKQELIMIKNNTLNRYKTSKQEIGKPKDNSFDNYQDKKIKIEHNEIFYIFSDGYADQIGEKNHHKFMKHTFLDILSKIHSLPMSEQKNILIQKHEQWRGNYPQTDDITVIGFKL